ncbi:MAG: hypothetical protein ACP5O1_11400 [Phycisphaerae bacterium]
MGEPEGTRRSNLEIEAVDPRDGSRTTVIISHDRLQAVARCGEAHIHEAANIVPEILLRPQAVFEGLCEDTDEDRRGVGWRCYCGIPSRAFCKDGSERPAYRGQVYLVFVNADRVAYNWRWEKGDENAPNLPIGYETRFKRRLL